MTSVPLYFLGLTLSMAVGVLLGLLGGGGSILMVPVLVYVLGSTVDQAVPLSLLVVGTTGVALVAAHARAGRVRWDVGAVFGITSMAGAYLGGSLARFLPAAVVLIGFGVAMLATAYAMLRPRQTCRSAPLSRPKLAFVGALVGIVTGLVGAGGGFAVVPALVLFGGLAMPEAVATSLTVIALNSLTGLLGHLHGAGSGLDWAAATPIVAAALTGSAVGLRIGRRVDAALLRPLFGWFVLAMAVFVLGRELPAALGFGPPVPSYPPIILIAAIAIAVSGIVWTLRHSSGRKPAIGNL